jgi:hypothetical protein
MMNAYTLDPPKPESAAASAPPSVTAPVPFPTPAPIYMPINYQHQPHQHPQTSNVRQDTSKVRDWLTWSIISLFIGGLIPGFLPLMFSLICRSIKKKNEIHGARLTSNCALMFNIIITILGAAVLIGVFIYLLVFTQMIRNNQEPIF